MTPSQLEDVARAIAALDRTEAALLAELADVRKARDSLRRIADRRLKLIAALDAEYGQDQISAEYGSLH